MLNVVMEIIDAISKKTIFKEESISISDYVLLEKISPLVLEPTSYVVSWERNLKEEN